MDIACPVNWVVGDTQVGKDALVEVALADEQLVHLLEELTGTGTLDDAMIIRRGERYRLADTQIGQGGERHTLEFSGVFECSCADDGACPLHETRHGVLGTDAARVREGDGITREVHGGQLVVARAGDHVFVGDEEFLEAHRLGVLDAGHQQGTGAIGLGKIDSDREVDVRRCDDRRLAVDLLVEDVLARELLERLHESPRDEMGERHLAAARALEMVVDDDAIVDQEFGRDSAHARRCGNGETGVHVRGERLGHAPERGDDVLGLEGLGIRRRGRHSHGG